MKNRFNTMLYLKFDIIDKDMFVIFFYIKINLFLTNKQKIVNNYSKLKTNIIQINLIGPDQI